MDSLDTISTFTMFKHRCLCLLFVILLAGIQVSSSFDEAEDDEVLTTNKDAPLDCSSDYHVCQTLIKMNYGEVLDEEPYCLCDTCLPEWKEDKKQLTWVHYERRDYTVMYRFCADLEELNKCEENETAIHLETDVSGWNPRIKQAYCNCDGVHHLAGWRKTAGTWRYNYRCEKRQCGKADPCLRQYVNGQGKTMGYKFMCECEDGYHCPTEQEYNSANVETDENGDRYLYDYCEQNLGRKQTSSKYASQASTP